MAKKLFNSLFGRQLSYGSENEEPATLQEAYSSNTTPQLEPQLDANDQPPMQQQFQQMNIEPQLQPSLNIAPQHQNIAPQMQLPSQNFSPPEFQQQLSSAPGGEDMNVAYKASNVIVRERIKKENPDDIALLDSVDQSDIIVVRGTYDHIHLVLEAIGIPFLAVNPGDLMRMTLRPDQTVYVNCPSSFPADAAKKLEGFVKSGGQLITTDWALKNVIEVAFPKTVRHNGQSSGDEVVSIEIVAKDDEILKGFIDQEKDAAPVWWLECASYPIEVLDKKKVKVLVRSDDLKRKYGADPVIISFNHGEGVVYHMISHFYLQRSETRTHKQSLGTVAYAEAQNMTESSRMEVEGITKGYANVNYGVVQSASTSSEFVSRGVLKQKRKYASKLM